MPVLGRGFTDRLDVQGSSVGIDDAAYWSKSRWLYLRRVETRSLVLGDAVWSKVYTYTVQRGALLAAVSKRTDVPLAMLKRLNPTAQ